jgi:hypothetical protein
LDGQIYVADGAGSGTWVENSRAFGGYLTFSTASPYAHSTTTSDTIINPSFTAAINNGFTGLSSPNARVRYDGTETISASLHCGFSLQQASGSLKQLQLAIYKNGSELPGSRMIASIASGEWRVLPLLYDTTLSTDDYIEVVVKADASCTVNFAAGYLQITGIAA